jgi:hypothetical protein
LTFFRFEVISEHQSDVDDENDDQQNEEEEEDQSYASRIEQNSISEHSVVKRLP